MEKAKIGVISPYEEFTQIVEQTARDFNLDVFVCEETGGKIAETVQEWEAGGRVEIIIARGAIAAGLKRKVKTPVVMIEVTSYDIVEAICRAKTASHGGIGITLLDIEQIPPRYDYEAISKIVGVDFNVILYRSERELYKTIEKAAGNKSPVMVGTSLGAVEIASGKGFETVLVHSSREFIQDAMKKAKDICRVRRRDLRLCRSFQSILNNAYDGILAVEKNEITIFNPVAEKTTGLKSEEVLGRPILEVCRTNAVCRALYGDGKPASSIIVYLGDLPIVVSRVPVMLGQNNYGITVTFQAADKIKRIEAKIRQELNSQGLVAKFRFSDIIGRSAMIAETIREARKYARSEATVLITGESGTGKELFAQSMHNESNRRDGPFVAINCAALPENLLESELFGYEEGAFTGARKGGKQGLFTLAHGGTIFLDEVSELSLGLQARLLRVLQEKEVMPVGGQRVIPVDVRIISATNQNLSISVNEGTFRKDLFFRLNVLNLQIPPLRNRLEDVPELFKHFFGRLAGPGSMEAYNLDGNLLDELKMYMWPGNIRELEGFAERYAALGEDNTRIHSTFYGLFKKLVMGAIDHDIKNDGNHLTIQLGSIPDMEKQILTQASRLIRGNKGEMAKILGISRTTLWKKLKDLDIEITDEGQTV
ncbi:MAG: sigma 54-interacting transcriptional regulator [Bacillota bacterium]